MGKRYNVIDLFSGAGGLSLGFEHARFKNVFSIDFMEDYCDTYRRNFPHHRLIQKDITKLSDKDILKLTKNKDVDVVIGGPPCQGFSIAGKIGRNFMDDPRNNLFKEFARVVSLTKPKIFVMENVARLYTHNQGKTRKDILDEFRKLGYDVECKILCSADYGVPQLRNRVIFIGNRLGLKNKFPDKKYDKNSQSTILKRKIGKWKTIKEAIDDLPKLSSGEVSNIPNHEAMSHTERMLNKMGFIKDGGDRFQIPIEIRPKSGDIRKYIKYNSSKPSICITGDMRKVFHYNQNRALTVRELARIQSFPDSFVFEGNKISQQQQVGNAVPPLMAKTIAEEVKNMLNQNE